MKYTTVTGKKQWRTTGIQSILTNEKYYGSAYLGKTCKRDVLSKDRVASDEVYYVENSHPAIIPKDTWDLVQVEMVRKKEYRTCSETGNGKYSSKYPFSKKLICGECGMPLRRHAQYKKGEYVRTLDALSKIGYTCMGNRPWLGREQHEECGEKLLVLQRGASNVWFADIISSVYIPQKYKNENTEECVKRGIKKFASSRINSEIDKESIKKFVIRNQDYCEDIDEEQAIAKIISILNNPNKDDSPQTEDEYRKQEFDVLAKTSGNPKEELYVKNYPTQLYNNLTFLKSISLVHKLRETRVFLGFRRITTEGDDGPAQISVNKIP